MFSAFLFAAKLAQALAKSSAVILRLPVKLAFADQVLDCCGYEIANGLASRNPVSDFGGGNVYVPADSGIRMLGPEPAAIEDGKLDHSRKVGESVPGRKLSDVVFADQENKFGIRLALFQRFDRVHGVGRRGACEFQLVETKPRLALDGSADHLGAQIAGRWVLSRLVRRTRRRDEEKAVEVQLVDGIAREDQVPIMDGIESAADDADLFHGCEILFRSSTRKVK